MAPPQGFASKLIAPNSLYIHMHLCIVPPPATTQEFDPLEDEAGLQLKTTTQ
jgi:hypothetical protein